MQIHTGVTKALIALGANLPSDAGEPDDTLRAALDAVGTTTGGGIRISAVSRFYRTPCVPKGAGPDYVNAVAELAVTLDPDTLLARLHAIEADFGRARLERWGRRTLDLDLLDFGGEILPDLTTQSNWRDISYGGGVAPAPDRLILPHPRMAERAFVLVPLRDVAPRWRHPVTGATVDDMLAALDPADIAEVRALPG